MKISNELEWFRPYIEAASKYVPINRIDKVLALHPSPKKINRHQAQITTQANRAFITFYVSIYKLDKLPSKRVLASYTRMELLCNLAHELAHLKHWDHTPQHKRLEAKLTILFMGVLEKTGYISEEEEYKHPPFK